MEAARRRAWVEVDLGALIQNATTMARRAGRPLLPMVKADAYGLGAVEVSRALQALEPWGFGVATTDEAAQLRKSAVRTRILIFSPLLPWDFPSVRELDVTPALGDVETISAWIESGGGPWHLAIDTGMHRAGVPWWQIGSVIELVRRYPPEGACTHFHSADRADDTRAAQEDRFREAVAHLPVAPEILHAENSPSLERRAPSPWSLARPGVFLYGVGGEEGSQVVPVPVASLRGRIVSILEVPAGEGVSYGATWRATTRCRVATVSLGYADGYRRALSNRGTALVCGRRAPVVGLVTMDMTMLDVTGIPCAVGDVATFIGRDGDELLDVNTVAHTGDLSPYELLTGLRQRLPRLYVGGITHMPSSL